MIPHVDDLGCASGANKAMVQLAASGAVTSGSVMVPAMWFADVASIASAEDLDLGVHLTLTSESAAARWRPVEEPGVRARARSTTRRPGAAGPGRPPCPGGIPARNVPAFAGSTSRVAYL
ncbi:MAG: ChbG/HpnK family deacetylase [Acidobacteria bacterium]|nr:ChbG/HpnK family deacetylase [Acidobacteriota bacterium]